MSERRTARVAAVQIGSQLFDTPATLVRAERALRDAAARGASLAVLPEALLGGYPKGLSFGVTVGSRDPGGRELFGRYADSAITVPGPETDRLAQLATELDLTIVAGVVERSGGTLYCTAVFLLPGRGLVAKHRKLMPTAAERCLWGQGDGSTMAAVPSPVGILGAAICWENYMPLFRAAMYAQGVEVWCAPTVDARDQWQSTVRHVALEGRCYLISAAQYLTRANYPDDVHPVHGDDPGAVLIDGGSVIVSPLGDVIAGPIRDGEGVITADIDLGSLNRARFDFDVNGHYSRPDIFTLHVEATAKAAVRLIEGDDA